MTTGVYRFTFDKGVALSDAEATLHLAMIAAGTSEQPNDRGR